MHSRFQIVPGCPESTDFSLTIFSALKRNNVILSSGANENRHGSLIKYTADHTGTPSASEWHEHKRPQLFTFPGELKELVRAFNNPTCTSVEELALALLICSTNETRNKLDVGEGRKMKKFVQRSKNVGDASKISIWAD
jgi:hypothetical protein